MEITIQHNPERKQFYTIVDQKTAHLDYKVSADGKTWDYHHTFVPPELRGQKIAEKMVKYALDYAKAHQIKVIPTCPYVERLAERYPEYDSIIVKK